MMKINEVPQDEAFLEEGKIRDLCYAVDDKGKYAKVFSKGWTPKNDAMKLAWDNVYDHARETRKRVLAGELSPIAFYMEINVMDIGLLASYMNLSRRRVKRHLKVKVFRKLKPEIITRYAEIFGIELDDLIMPDRLQEIKLENENKLST